MKNFFKNLSYNFQSWMRGRYGWDLLTWVLLIVGLLISFSCNFLNASGGTAAGIIAKILGVISTASIVFGVYRVYSSNHDARKRENDAFKNIFRGPINSIKIIKYKKQDQTHLYVKCPNCKAIMRVPKGNGRIIITCPKCQNKVEVKS